VVDDEDIVKVDEFALNAIPGYMGYIRGIQPETRYGASIRRMSTEAYLERKNESPMVVPKTATRMRYRPGLDVTGYTGFVPGKYADNVFGKTFANSNFASQKLKRKQSTADPLIHDAFVEKVLRDFERISPSNTYGNYPLYSASRARTAGCA
jgi:hypothetical protein